MTFDKKAYNKKWRKDRVRQKRIDYIASGGRFRWICEVCGHETIVDMDTEGAICTKCKRERVQQEKEAERKRIASEFLETMKRKGILK
jgi:hypothetical protein